jgi:hypothetical protein
MHHCVWTRARAPGRKEGRGSTLVPALDMLKAR